MTTVRKSRSAGVWAGSALDTIPLATAMLLALAAVGACDRGDGSADADTPQGAEASEVMAGDPVAGDAMAGEEIPGDAGGAPSAGLLNPNLAAEDAIASIAAVGGEAAAAVVAGRPYLRASELHAALSGAVGDAAAATAYESLWLPINLNDVANDEILLIPGVGDRMAHEFEEYRPYADMGEFRREIGKYVDAAEVERLAQYVYVPINLNTATRDEIMAVPGMSDRMAHEFEEYRPYADLDQFRREIGKYVNEDEVARLERYVTLN